MRKSSWTPSIVPDGDDHNVYLVMDDLGRLGRVWREADVEAAELEAVILGLLAGQYKNPVRVVVFNTAEKWSRECPPTSPRSCAGAAICGRWTFRSSCRTSSIVMRAGEVAGVP